MMERTASINLDLARWLAAMAVFSTHFLQQGTDGIYRTEVEPLGRLGVVFFFVLSGYVISATALKKHTDMVSYTAARLGRLHSVLIPAMALTWVADLIGSRLAPEIYAHTPSPTALKTGLSAPLMISFLYENSIFSTRWLSNSPMWSIAYEFWYYMIFGSILFYRGSIRILLTAIFIFIAGWKIILLSPTWALGVFIERLGNRSQITTKQKIAGIFISLAVIAFFTFPAGHEMLAPLREAGRRLPQGYHSNFLSDWLLALPVGMLVWILRSHWEFNWPSKISTLIRSLAGGSFALYLFHLPLIYLIKATHIYAPSSSWQCLLSAMTGLTACHLLSKITESNKRPWVEIFEHLLLKIIPGKYRGKNDQSRI